MESPSAPSLEAATLKDAEPTERAREASNVVPTTETHDFDTPSSTDSLVEDESQADSDATADSQSPELSRSAPPSRPAPNVRPATPERRPYPPAPRRDFRPASPKAVQEAIQDVNRIVETLKAALEDMEELLETLELAERQQEADEQEIESLRRSLRPLHRPPERGPRH